jgi:holo-[acyl-carrier protein] synthase
MSVRVGTDLVSVAAVQESIDRFGERYLARVYTPRELDDCDGDPVRLAARFAAKEAVVKVLRPGRGVAVPWADISLRREPGGWAELELTGRAADLARSGAMDEWSVSIAHENGYATAVVVAEVSA